MTYDGTVVLPHRRRCVTFLHIRTYEHTHKSSCQIPWGAVESGSLCGATHDLYVLGLLQPQEALEAAASMGYAVEPWHHAFGAYIQIRTAHTPIKYVTSDIHYAGICQYT